MSDERSLELPGLVRALRRRLNLSQGALADQLGVSAGTVGRWETGARVPGLAEFERLLRLANWHLVVVEEDGRTVVEAMRSDAVRDRGGRLYPAHLDVLPVPPDQDDWGRRSSSQWAPRKWRRDRDRMGPGRRPKDHPDPQSVRDHEEALRLVRKWRQIANAEALRYQRMTSGEWAGEVMDCMCPMECYENVYCVPDCPCGCEARDED